MGWESLVRCASVLKYLLVKPPVWHIHTAPIALNTAVRSVKHVLCVLHGPQHGNHSVFACFPALFTGEPYFERAVRKK